MYLKKLDMASGKWYYLNRRTGETTWDVPRGQISMAPPPEKLMNDLEKEKQEIRLAKAKEKKKRDFLIEQRKEEYRQSLIKETSAAEEAERKRRDDLWKDAVNHGSTSGEVNMSWQKLGDVSQRVYDFRRSTTRDLIHLRLVGHELESLPDELSRYCPMLISLTLTSNRLASINCVAELTHLTSLVAIRNRITHLPPLIGNLVQLKILELASNRLEVLPATFGNLTNLAKLNLECNRLRRIPETLSRLTIKTLNLNSNDLVSLPRCLGSMPNLVVLSVNSNRLKYLPSEIGDSKTLAQLHVCNNRLMELPEEIGKLGNSLTNLWLDFNNLSAVPMSFYKLTNLIELKMEGNLGMVFPTIDKIIKGPKTVVAWSKKRYATSLYARQQAIVLSFQDILKQVGKHCVGGEDHRGIYEANVQFEIPGTNKSTKGPRDTKVPLEEGEGELFYQYPEEMFWDTFLPALDEIWNDEENFDTKGDIKSFTYPKGEVERVMGSFQDPYGPVIYRSPTGWFRRCVCKKPDGSRNVCIPPKAGWMCERPVMLVKMKITLERELEERNRQQQERERVKEVCAASEKSAKEWLELDEGKLFIRKLAEVRAHELQHSEADSKFRGAVELEFRRRRKKLEKAFKKKEKKLQERRNEHHNELEEKRKVLDEKGSSLQGWAAEQNDIAIDKILEELANLPEDEDLGKLQDKYEADLAKLIKEIEKKAEKGSLVERIVPKALLEFKQSMGREHNEKLNELMVDLKRQYVDREVYRARKKIKSEHEKLRKIMTSWTGLGMRDTFKDWKVWTKHRVHQRRRDIRRGNREARLGYEQEMANKDFARWNLDKWKKHWDDFNDLHYWVHDVTGESTYDEPNIETYQPKGWVEPDPPACMLDEITGELLTPRSLRRKEADTPSEHSEGMGAPDDDSDEEWKRERGLDGEDSSDEDESKPNTANAAIENGPDDAVAGMVPEEGEGAVVLADIPVTQELGVGFANEDDVKDMNSGAIVARPSTSQGMVVRGEVDGVMAKSQSRDFVGVKAEQDAAAARVLARRKQQIKRRMQRDALGEGGGGDDGDDGKASEVAKLLAAKEAEEAEKNRIPTEEEVMAMVGFDETKVDSYSDKELDAFAKKALAMNKKLGRTANGGVGDLTGPDGRNYGRYEPDLVTGFFQQRAENAKVNAKLAEERAKKYGGDGGGKKDEDGRDNSATGLGTVFSRQGKRIGGKKKG
jgi:hypothetical protein